MSTTPQLGSQDKPDPRKFHEEATLTEGQLAWLKDFLLRKRGEILVAASASDATIRELSSGVETRKGDLGDQSVAENEIHIRLRIKNQDAKILQGIAEALYRMEKGVYGVCIECGDPVAFKRLEAIPWTRVCIDCKQKPKPMETN